MGKTANHQLFLQDSLSCFHKMNLSLISLFLLLLFSRLSLFHGCHDNERNALLSFKSLLIDPSNRLSSWQDRNCCTWHGIRCSNSSHVISINLRNPYPDNIVRRYDSEIRLRYPSKFTAINGKISPSLFTLVHLRHLDLSFNYFNFSKIPHQFANLKRLVYLNLSNSMFSDSITTQFSNLSSIKILDLSCAIRIFDSSSLSNNLSTKKISLNSSESSYSNGHLICTNLNWLQGLVNLKVLTLNGVDLSAASQVSNWAEPISYLHDLRNLSLISCGISGPIPMKHFLNLTYLSLLGMGFNFLYTPIPIQLANLTSLSILGLYESHLLGHLPFFPQLEQLYVHQNRNLTIDLPLTFAHTWPNLKALDIQFTNAVGYIPASISNSSSMIELRASKSLIQGPIPSSLFNLSNLQYLDLSYNNVTGMLPSSISSARNLKRMNMFQNNLRGEIPESICEISSLQDIVLAANNFSGSLPDCIGRLPNLATFYISQNSMEGTVSLGSFFQNSTIYEVDFSLSGIIVETDQYPFLSKFQLTRLGLGSCKLRGEIPSFISNMTQLSMLLLFDNNLTGTIPHWLFNLRNLSWLDLSRNNLTGVLPPTLRLQSHIFQPVFLNLAYNNLQGSLPLMLNNIEILDLSFNNFTGEIPNQIGERLPNARYVSFSGNRLCGPIPPSFCTPSNVLLWNLDLSNNSLSGPIPSTLGNCRSLISLNLGRNELTGNLPTELAYVKNLRALQLNDNNFNGPFPDFISRLQSMEFLILNNNMLEGKIPTFIGNLNGLRILALRANFFTESIPNEITHLQNLQILDLSYNKLTGPIPNKMGNFRPLVRRPTDASMLGIIISVAFAKVHLELSMKKNVYNLSLLYSYESGIDLSSNLLEGNIPMEVSWLQALRILNLSHNRLHGEIPTTVGNMSGLESLDLSFNHLAGKIPASLAKLDFLGSLDLSYNNLSGEIPSGGHLDTFNVDGSSYIGNAFLCGAPLQKRRETTSNKNDSEVEMEKDGWNTWLTYVLFVVGYAIGFWGPFVVLAMRREQWGNRYWRYVDDIALRIIE